MEASRARGNRDDNPRLPTLGLGLTSVRLIVNKIESEYARAVTSESGRELVKYDPNVDEGYDDYYDSPLDASSGRVWSRFAVNLGIALSRCIPSVSFANFGLLALATGFFAPRMISYLVIYPFCRLVFGTLYPAYASYKAVRTKNLKEYVKWMMYWIVFALFTCTETFTDVFLSWFPFYYEVKIVLVLWLLSPATKGSSILYRKFVHPALCRREQEIDEYIAKAKDQGYHTVLNLGTKGVNYATTVIMQTAIKGGGGLVQQLRKSYSLSDLTECDPRDERGADEADDVLTEPRLIRRATVKSGYNARRSASESNSRSPLYFSEVDVGMELRSGRRIDERDFGHIKSNEDISSGYSSADNSASLTRTASVGAAQRAKSRTTRTTVTTIKRPQAAEDNEVIIEELHDDEFDYTNMPALLNLPPQLYLSNTDPPFIYQYVGDQIKIIQVLGNNTPISTSDRIDNDNDQGDQKDTSFEDASPLMDTIDKQKTEASNILDVLIKDDTNSKNNVSKTKTEVVENQTIESTLEIKEKDSNLDSSVNVPNLKEFKMDNKVDVTANVETNVDINSISHTTDKAERPKQSQNVTVTAEDTIESTSLDTSFNDVDSAESDDEASFGTPEDSPKSKRRSPKGRYGKGKAPPPPPVKSENFETTNDNKKQTDTILTAAINTTSQECSVDIVNKLPNNSLKEMGASKGLQVVNPIAEKKRRHKSKSPGRISKGSSSGIGKLLQLPGKLAFWNKPDDKNKDNVSTSSGDISRRSSINEKTIDEFPSFNELNVGNDALNQLEKSQKEINQINPKASKQDEKLQTEIADDQLSFKDASDFESEVISHEIMEKSDALQRLIEAKLESHPEYKTVSLYEEIVATSKSTDV